VVVGGGISGLAAAHALSQLPDSPRVTVVEAGERLGGKLGLAQVGGIVLDAGAESLLTRRPEAIDLVTAAGLAADLVHPARSGASVLCDGTLRPLPAGQVLGIPFDRAALSASGVLTDAGLAAVDRDSEPDLAVDDDVAIGALVRSRMGDEVVDRLVEPLLGGVYAGHADRLSFAATLPEVWERLSSERTLVAAAGAASAARAAASSGPAFASIAGGLGRLPDALAVASGFAVRLRTAVRHLTRDGRGWRVATDDGELPADAVVLAVPGWVVAELLEPIAPEGAAPLGELEYASVALVAAVFDRDAVPDLPGTGYLASPAEGRLVKAATFSSLKWGWLGAAHPDSAVVRASVGRHGESSCLERPDDELAEAAVADLGAVTGITGVPLATGVLRWERSLPQYPVGHVRHVAEVRHALGGLPTVALCGAALDGVGIPACIASGQTAAAQVAAALKLRGRMAP
jgi:oxygen-dependent protoporphyrinogen oxidase